MTPNIIPFPEPSDETMRIIARGILRAPKSPPDAVRRACETLRNSPHSDDRLMADIKDPAAVPKLHLVSGEEAWQRAHEFPAHERPSKLVPLTIVAAVIVLAALIAIWLGTSAAEAVEWARNVGAQQ